MRLDPTAAAVDLDETASLWADLHTARDRGTARRWNQHENTPEQQAKALARDRQERLDRDEAIRQGREPLGWSPSPSREDVVDVIADLTVATLELEEEMREYLGEPMARPDERPHLVTLRPAEEVEVRVQPAGYHAPSRFFDEDNEPLSGYSTGTWTTVALGTGDLDPRVPEALRWLAGHAGRIHDHDKLEHLLRESRRMVRAARRALGSAERVQRLKSPCPICNCLSLVAFLDRCPPDYRPCDKRDCDPLQHGLIVCSANTPTRPGLVIDQPCRCQLEECPVRCEDGGRHRWPAGDWERLLMVLEEEAS